MVDKAVCQGVGVGLGVVFVVLIHLSARPLLQAAATPVSRNTEFWHETLVGAGLTQSDLMTSISHGTADWFSPVSVANELTAQYSNTWLLFAVAVSSALQKPSTFPSSTCIDLLRGDSCVL